MQWKPTRRTVVGALTATVASPLVARAQGNPVRIGVLAPLTGGGGPYGPNIVKASKLAAEQINKSGGILGGRMIELFVEDDETPLRQDHAFQSDTGQGQAILPRGTQHEFAGVEAEQLARDALPAGEARLVNDAGAEGRRGRGGHADEGDPFGGDVGGRVGGGEAELAVAHA